MINLYIDLSDLNEVGGRKEVVTDVNFADLSFRDRDIEIPKPLHLEFTIFKTQDSFVIRGKVTGSIVLACSRCLEKFQHQLDLEVDEEIIATEMPDLNELDISDIIRENILLNLAIKPLCAEDCKGLCVECGQNLNEEECDCDTEIIDPRLADLKNFFDDN